MIDDGGEYVAYLLRLWRAQHDHTEPTTAGWRAVLEHVQTGERTGFGSLDELFAFLRREAMVRTVQGSQRKSQADGDECR